MSRRKLTTEEFIDKARKVHGTKYSYDKVEYVSSNKKVIITCPTHGDFPQVPNSHTKGRGCPSYSGRRYRNNTKCIEDGDMNAKIYK